MKDVTDFKSDSKGRVAAVILAAGAGNRFGGDKAKQYYMLGDKSIIDHTITAFEDCDGVDIVLVVLSEGDGYFDGDVMTCYGGEDRQGSAFNGLIYLFEECGFGEGDIVLIHDAARPFVCSEMIGGVIDVALEKGNAVPSVPVVDSLRYRSRAGIVPREGLLHIQTPQGFNFAEIYAAHLEFEGDNLGDDAALIEAKGGELNFVKGERNNIKITHLDDLNEAMMIYNERKARLLPHIGQGYDVHAFCEGDFVMLCGVKIPHSHGFKAHSDGDVALHAITDAILGALADGDIGTHFPPSDMKWKGVSSDRFLEFAMGRVAKRGGIVQHIDVTFICEAPKIGKYREKMQESLAKITGLPLSSLSIKATTSEKLGFEGRREGVAASVVATVLLP